MAAQQFTGGQNGLVTPCGSAPHLACAAWLLIRTGYSILNWIAEQHNHLIEKNSRFRPGLKALFSELAKLIGYGSG
jgi:hypothetical protein